MNSENIEHITPQYSDVIEQYQNQINRVVEEYCYDNDIDNLKKEPQNVFYALLMTIGKTVFSDRSKLKYKGYIYNNNINNIMPSNYNSYDYDLLNYLADIYIMLCYKYNKEVNIIGFSYFVNIDYKTIMDWKYRKDENKLTSQSSELFEKILRTDQESLFALLSSGSVNPVGVFGVGKQRFGWEDKKTEHTIIVNRSLTSSELPKLSANNSHNLQVVDNDEQQTNS